MKKMTAIAAVSSCLYLIPLAASAQTQAASTTATNPLSQVDKDFVQAASMSSAFASGADGTANRMFLDGV